MVVMRDIHVMIFALAVAQEAINKFKRGEKLTMREKMLCLMVFVRAMESANNLMLQSTTFPAIESLSYKTDTSPHLSIQNTPCGNKDETPDSHFHSSTESK